MLPTPDVGAHAVCTCRQRRAVAWLVRPSSAREERPHRGPERKLVLTVRIQVRRVQAVAAEFPEGSTSRFVAHTVSWACPLQPGGTVQWHPGDRGHDDVLRRTRFAIAGDHAERELCNCAGAVNGTRPLATAASVTAGPLSWVQV